MKCGFYEIDITPELGSIIPGAFGARYSDEILNPLFVRVIVIENEEKTLAIASIDACGITLDITENIRKKVSDAIGIPFGNIMITATHAHGAGPTLTWGEEVVRNEEYITFLEAKTADAICMAHKKLADSEIYTGADDLRGISFVRVYKLKNGGLKTNPPPAMMDQVIEAYTDIDPEVCVMAIKQNDKFAGAVINFANHPASVADTRITGDYISVLSDELKKIYGNDFITVFINGACGNINNVNPFNREENEPAHVKVGKALAKKVEEIIKKSNSMVNNKLDSVTDKICVKYRKPTEEQLLNAKKVFDNLGDGLIDSVPGTVGYRDTFFALQTFLIMADKRTLAEINLQVFKIGDCFIFGTPTQLFNEYGKKMKKACDGLIFVSAFANDYSGYVPVPECMKDGVYEATLAKTSALEPAAGDKITDAIIEMYKKIK